MQLFLTVALLFYTTILSFTTRSSADSISGNVNTSCTPNQTECALGCCPYKDAVCCADGSHCCKHGEICIPTIDMCVGIHDEESGKMALFSKEPTVVQNSGAACPQGTTTCGHDHCCPFSDAVCCSDDIHCCPHGFKCDMQRRGCVLESGNHTKSSSMEHGAVAVTQPSKMLNKLPYKVCPGGKMICPGYNSCCIDDNGSWSCCPSVTNNRIRAGVVSCCDSIFGHICCTIPIFPLCTFFGCI